MTQEQIDRLHELKKLVDSGILTEEELQIEKDKILNVSSIHQKNDAPYEKSVINNHILNDRKKLKFNIFLAVAFFLVVGIIIFVVLLSKKSTYANSYADTSEEYRSNSFPEINTDVDDEDEFAFDPWIGTLIINGAMYRTCESKFRMHLKKISKGEYNGTFVFLLGYEEEELNSSTHEFEPTGRFIDDRGSMEGEVRCKVDGNDLVVVLSSFNIVKKTGIDGNEWLACLAPGQQIFRLTYDVGYSVKPIGEMEGFFDGSEPTVSW